MQEVQHSIFPTAVCYAVPKVGNFSILNSAENEIFISPKYKKYQEIQLFYAHICLECYFPAHRY